MSKDVFFLRSDEVINNITSDERGLLDTPVNNRPTLRQGDTGPWVSELQRELRQVTFYNGPINGIFDAATNTAVRNFQSANNLTVNGIVERNTWSALIFLYAPLARCPNNALNPYPFKGIVIDAGHGGADPGAIGNGIIEKEINLKISKYMNDRFYELNIPHAMTRTEDETLSSTERINRAVNAFGRDPGVILISNHNNAGGGEGAEVIYPLRSKNTYPLMILNELKLAGQVIRRAYTRPLPDDPNRDFFFILRETSPLQAVLVEYAFLDNAADAQRLEFNWMRYAEGVIKATCEYINYPYQPPYSNIVVYKVQAGDTLFSIARQFQTTVEIIMSANNLTSTVLSIGQELKIPMFDTDPFQPGEPITYTVVRGDTLFSIAQRFNTTVAAIRSLNNLTTDTLSIGQVLRIPGPGTIPPEETFNYTVVRGDTLFALAQRFNTTVAEIRRLNNLTTDTLSIGQVLRIPGRAPTTPGNYFNYTVVRGDSLSLLAQRFGTTTAAIRSLNNLTSDLLSIGQILRIPGTAPPSFFNYTVKAGDSLWSIAQRFNTTVNAITNLNNLTSTTLRIGQVLRIPS